MDKTLFDLAKKNAYDSVYKQMKCTDEPIVCIYDLESELGQIISKAYLEVLPSHAKTIEFDENKGEEIKEILLGLPEGANVFLLQSTSFRLDDFRIRLILFNNGVGCAEHSHLAFIPENQYETYIKAFEYNGEEFSRLGNAVGTLLSTSEKIKIYSGENDVLEFGQMEESKINDGRFYAQKNRGGSAICGEVFSESRDFSSVNGRMTVNCYPNERFEIIQCEPFSIKIEKSFITEVDKNAPKEFMDNIIDRVKEGEDGEVMMREAGFGLNYNISLKTPLKYVNMCERMVGFHISVGKKHNVYRKKFHKSVIQRFHIDIFADVKKMVVEKDGDEVVFFEGGKYVV